MRYLALFLLFAACAPDSTAPVPELGRIRTANGERPNVLLVLTDDQEAASIAHMPKVQQDLVASGVTFDAAFAATSLCCPSRLNILRGQYAHNHGIFYNVPPAGGHDLIRSRGLESSTLATWLQDAGYRTALIGKYINGYDEADAAYTPPGWNEWRVFSNYAVTEMVANGAVVSWTGAHHSDVVRDLALDFIRTTQQPWFAVMSFKAPHAPEIPASRHDGAFAGFPLPKPPSYNVPNGIGTTPDDTMSTVVQQALTRRYRDRLETLLSVDEAVGVVWDELRTLDVLSKTLIIYTTDNGWLNGEHAMPDGKNLPYEESVRIPLVIRGPNLGIKTGTHRAHLAANIDLAPTIADFAGVPVPAWVDGRSLRAVLTTPGSGPPLAEWRRALLVEHWIGDGPPGGPSPIVAEVHGVRSRSRLYAEWSTGEREMYDVVNDPWQMHKMAGPFAPYPAWLAALRTCAGATCRTFEDSAP